MEENVGQNTQYEVLSTLGQHSVVTIRVDSPRDSPLSSPREELLPELQILQQQSPVDLSYNEPIDVNLPCDTTNVFYDYPIDDQQLASTEQEIIDIVEDTNSQNAPPDSS